MTENPGSTNFRRFRCFLHSHKLLVEDCEELIVTILPAFREEIKIVAYPYTLITNHEAPDSLGDMFTSDLYWSDSRKMFLKASNTSNTSPKRHIGHITIYYPAVYTRDTLAYPRHLHIHPGRPGGLFSSVLHEYGMIQNSHHQTSS